MYGVLLGCVELPRFKVTVTVGEESALQRNFIQSCLDACTRGER